MITSGGGDVIVDGYGGSSVAGTPGSDGVHVDTGGTISAGGLGDVTVTGSGATLSGTGLVGVRVIGSGATITSSGGDVAVAGVGGGSSTVGIYDDNFGIEVAPLGLISAGGMGDVSLTGTGGSGGGGFDMGVVIYGIDLTSQSPPSVASPAIVTSSGGDISITGTGGAGGTSGYNVGVGVGFGGAVLGVNFGSVTINGTGGVASGSDNYGFATEGFENGAQTEVTTQGGDLSITGTAQSTGTAGNDNMGVEIEDGASVGSTATGDVTVYGTGGAGNQYNYGVDVSLDELGSQDGSLTVTGYGGGSDAGSNNGGVVIDSSQAGTSGDGAVSITGTGGLGTADAYGV